MSETQKHRIRCQSPAAVRESGEQESEKTKMATLTNHEQWLALSSPVESKNDPIPQGWNRYHIRVAFVTFTEWSNSHSYYDGKNAEAVLYRFWNTDTPSGVSGLDKICEFSIENVTEGHKIEMLNIY